ncbi:hypothetical protein GF380_02365 [Candidatus Uhrbacteria bacterium]|nr:hypothetical protein [Candidatus Uhrbacteria bacterium]
MAKNKQIWARITQAECDAMDKAAEMYQKSRSAFIRYCIVEKLKELDLLRKT